MMNRRGTPGRLLGRPLVWIVRINVTSPANMISARHGIIPVLAPLKELSRSRTHARPARVAGSCRRKLNCHYTMARTGDGESLPWMMAVVGNCHSMQLSVMEISKVQTVFYDCCFFLHIALLNLRRELEKSSARVSHKLTKYPIRVAFSFYFSKWFPSNQWAQNGRPLFGYISETKKSATYCRHFYQYRRRLLRGLAEREARQKNRRAIKTTRVIVEWRNFCSNSGCDGAAGLHSLPLV